MSFEAGLAKFRTNKDGMLEVGYIENPEDPEKKEKWELLSEVKQKYMTPIEESTVESYNKYLVDLAQKVTTETTTSNGYVRTYNKVFDAKDAKTLLMTSFGLDPSKDAKDNFNVNNIPRQLNHRFYDKNTRSIQSAADLEEAINDSVLTMKAAADEKTSREVLKTADDITLDKLQIANARKNLYKQDAPSGGSGSSEDGFVYGNTMLRVPAAKGNVGYYQQDAISLKGTVRTAAGKTAEGDDIPASTKDVFVTAYWNPNGGKKGNGSVAYGVSLPSAKGGMTTKPLASKQDPTGLSRAQQYLSNTDYVKLLKAASLIQNNTKLQRSGTFVEDVDMTYRNVHFNTLNK
jgi:hypothetical protein